MQPISITNNIETFQEGVQREWRHDRRLVIIRIPNPVRSTVDEWAVVHGDTVGNWPANQPILMLLDMRECGFTPYVREKSTEASERHKWNGQLALILQKGVVGLLFQQLARLLVRQQGDLQLGYYTDFDKGLAWLEQSL